MPSLRPISAVVPVVSLKLYRALGTVSAAAVRNVHVTSAVSAVPAASWTPLVPPTRRTVYNVSGVSDPVGVNVATRVAAA